MPVPGPRPGAIGSAVWFFWRRKTEQSPVFENIQKAEKLLALRKDLDNTNYTLDDLRMLEEALMGRSEVARKLSITYKQEAERVREIEMSGAMTQMELNIAAHIAYERAQQKLDSVIEHTKVFLSPEECTRFDKVNETWRTYQRSHAAFLASQYEGGSIRPLIHASVLECSHCCASS